jgi:regulator of replication initiation timing
MSGNNIEERIRELEEALQNTKADLSELSSQLIDERHLLARTHELAYTVTQENDQLKRRIEELEALEAQATQSEMRTQVQSPSPSQSQSPQYHHQYHHQHHQMSPVSVPTSPRVHQQQYQCSPAMASCDGMYYTHLHGTSSSSPPRLSPETPESAHQDQDEYEKDPAAYWVKEYPKWARKYNEEMEKLEAEEAEY